MEDKEFWKKRYKGKWRDGNRRELLIKGILEDWGFDVKDYGFEALSEDYNPASPEEKGKPDFKIKGKDFYVEVTGTDRHSVGPESGIWIRPDKIEYVQKRHFTCWVAHVLERHDLIRFIDITNIDRKKLKDVYPFIDGVREHYFEISSSKSISIEEFKKIIKKAKEK